MPTDPADLGLREAVRAVVRRRVLPSELTEAALARINQLNPKLNAVLTPMEEPARAAAQRLDRAVARGGKLGPLAGVPLTLKDLIQTRDAPTTLGSRVIVGGLPAERDAVLVGRLRRAGGVIVGKTNLHEVALGVTTVNEHFGAARNPWDRRLVAGGSSGGSAVAVATGMGLGSVGTDTRGSIRIPAACCGVVGFKPSYGAVPIDGVFPLAATLDHAGPLARSVEDAALLFGVMAGRGWLARAMAAVDRPLRRPRIALADYFFRDTDPEIARAVFEAVRVLERKGATVFRVELPELEHALEASRLIVLAEAISYHDPLLRRNRRGYGPSVRARLEGGYRVTGMEYVRAEERRIELMAAFGRLFEGVDCLIAPVLPVPPVRIGRENVVVGRRRVPVSTAYCRYNAPFNMTGLPALALPCGRGKAGVPIGLQVVAAAGQDETALGIGAWFQRLTDWHQARPTIT